MKIKRNTPCWCGSKIKYKKCHYAREQEEKISKGEALRFSKGLKKEKYCSAPESMKSLCTKKIIKAHTISKNGCLSDIADETNHVLGLKPNLTSIEKHKGLLVPERIGINNASTFTGFCSYHDNNIFSPLEKEEFKATDEQCFLLAYRSISREVYAKSNPDRFIDFLKQSDKGMSVEQQKRVQALASVLNTNMELDVKEFGEYKHKFDQYLVKKDFSKIKHFVIELKEPPPVMVSAIVAPSSDFKGKKIQDNTNPKSILQHIMFNSFSNDNKGYIVLSWLAEHEVISHFIESLNKIQKENMFSALIGFFFIYAENVYMSPPWWDGLNKTMQSLIIEKIQQGMFSAPKHSLSQGQNEFGIYEIEAIKSINF